MAGDPYLAFLEYNLKLPNGIVTDKTVFLGVDWSRKQIDAFDGKDWYELSSLVALAERFPDTVAFLEATAESYELQKRKVALEAFAKHNIDAYCFPSHWTASYRKEHHIAKKTNPTDAKVIREIGMTSPKTLSRFKELTNDHLGETISEFLIHDRYAFDGEETLKLAKEYLKNHPPEFNEFMKDSKKKWRKQVGRFAAIALRVREAGRGLKEYRRQIGNYAQGYGRIARSEFYFWLTRTITNTRLTKMGKKVQKGEGKWWKRMTAEQKQVHKEVLKQADKLLKYIWQCTASV